MDLPQRKRLRMGDHPYTNGSYFVTICTRNKQSLLSNIVGDGLCAVPSVNLTEIGEVVEVAIAYMDQTYDAVTVNNYVIMPNHVHLLITITDAAGGHGGPPLQELMRNFKSFTTHRYGQPLWQRSYFDHAVRSSEDFAEVWQYIETNPMRWLT